MIAHRRGVHAEMHICTSKYTFLTVVKAGKKGTMEHVFSQTGRKRREEPGSSFQLGHIKPAVSSIQPKRPATQPPTQKKRKHPRTFTQFQPIPKTTQAFYPVQTLIQQSFNRDAIVCEFFIMLFSLLSPLFINTFK